MKTPRNIFRVIVIGIDVVFISVTLSVVTVALYLSMLVTSVHDFKDIGLILAYGFPLVFVSCWMNVVHTAGLLHKLRWDMRVKNLAYTILSKTTPPTQHQTEQKMPKDLDT